MSSVLTKDGEKSYLRSILDNVTFKNVAIILAGAAALYFVFTAGAPIFAYIYVTISSFLYAFIDYASYLMYSFFKMFTPLAKYLESFIDFIATLDFRSWNIFAGESYWLSYMPFKTFFAARVGATTDFISQPAVAAQYIKSIQPLFRFIVMTIFAVIFGMINFLLRQFVSPKFQLPNIAVQTLDFTWKICKLFMQAFKYTFGFIFSKSSNNYKSEKNAFIKGASVNLSKQFTETLLSIPVLGNVFKLAGLSVPKDAEVNTEPTDKSVYDTTIKPQIADDEIDVDIAFQIASSKISQEGLSDKEIEENTYTFVDNSVIRKGILKTLQKKFKLHTTDMEQIRKLYTVSKTSLENQIKKDQELQKQRKWTEMDNSDDSLVKCHKVLQFYSIYNDTELIDIATNGQIIRANVQQSMKQKLKELETITTSRFILQCIFQNFDNNYFQSISDEIENNKEIKQIFEPTKTDDKTISLMDTSIEEGTFSFNEDSSLFNDDFSQIVKNELLSSDTQETPKESKEKTSIVDDIKQYIDTPDTNKTKEEKIEAIKMVVEITKNMNELNRKFKEKEKDVPENVDNPYTMKDLNDIFSFSENIEPMNIETETFQSTSTGKDKPDESDVNKNKKKRTKKEKEKSQNPKKKRAKVEPSVSTTMPLPQATPPPFEYPSFEIAQAQEKTFSNNNINLELLIQSPLFNSTNPVIVNYPAPPILRLSHIPPTPKPSPIPFSRKPKVKDTLPKSDPIPPPPKPVTINEPRSSELQETFKLVKQIKEGGPSIIPPPTTAQTETPPLITQKFYEDSMKWFLTYERHEPSNDNELLFTSQFQKFKQEMIYITDSNRKKPANLLGNLKPDLLSGLHIQYKAVSDAYSFMASRSSQNYPVIDKTYDTISDKRLVNRAYLFQKFFTRLAGIHSTYEFKHKIRGLANTAVITEENCQTSPIISIQHIHTSPLVFVDQKRVKNTVLTNKIPKSLIPKIYCRMGICSIPLEGTSTLSKFSELMLQYIKMSYVKENPEHENLSVWMDPISATPNDNKVTDRIKQCRNSFITKVNEANQKYESREIEFSNSAMGSVNIQTPLIKINTDKNVGFDAHITENITGDLFGPNNCYFDQQLSICDDHSTKKHPFISLVMGIDSQEWGLKSEVYVFAYVNPMNEPQYSLFPTEELITETIPVISFDRKSKGTDMKIFNVGIIVNKRVMDFDGNVTYVTKLQSLPNSKAFTRQFEADNIYCGFNLDMHELQLVCAESKMFHCTNPSLRRHPFINDMDVTHTEKNGLVKISEAFLGDVNPQLLDTKRNTLCALLGLNSIVAFVIKVTEIYVKTTYDMMRINHQIHGATPHKLVYNNQQLKVINLELFNKSRFCHDLISILDGILDMDIWYFFQKGFTDDANNQLLIKTGAFVEFMSKRFNKFMYTDKEDLYIQ